MGQRPDDSEKWGAEMSEQNSNEQWHLDKKVPLSLIFAMLVQAAMVILAISDIKKDVEVLKAQAISQRDREDRQERINTETFQLLRNQLEKMDQKLDRLVEHRK